MAHTGTKNSIAGLPILQSEHPESDFGASCAYSRSTATSTTTLSEKMSGSCGISHKLPPVRLCGTLRATLRD